MNNSESWKSWEGRVVDGKFPLRQWIGGSDHSAVFLTERAGQGSPKAAIKVIPAARDDQQLARLRAAAQLSHPHLLPVFATGASQIDSTSILYIVTEYAEEDLSQILPQRALTPAEVFDMLPPVLDAVAYLHGKGFVHGGIRPSNVLAAADQLKLSPDRISRAGEEFPPESSRDVYDAPETAIEPLTPAADVWSIGVLLVATLTQHTPIEGAEPKDPYVPDSISEPFRSIARDCLRNDPAQRIPIAHINARLLGKPKPVPVPKPIERAAPAAKPALSASPAPKPGARPPAPATPSAPRDAANWNWQLVLPVAVVLLIAAIAIGYFVTRHSESPAEPVSKIDQTPAPASSPAAATNTNPPASAASSPVPAANPESPGTVTREVLPDIPKSAQHTIQGTIKVAVRVQVDDSGKVTEAKLTSAGHSPYFANLALTAAQRWEFSPPTVAGQPAASAWTIHFQFKRSGTHVSSARAH